MGLFSGYKCDHCGAQVTYYGVCGKRQSEKVDKALLKMRARAAGWHVGINTYCPQCKHEVR